MFLMHVLLPQGFPDPSRLRTKSSKGIQVRTSHWNQQRKYFVRLGSETLWSRSQEVIFCSLTQVHTALIKTVLHAHVSQTQATQIVGTAVSRELV